MAKKQAAKTTSMSQHIKAYLAMSPDAGPKAVIEALAKKGITVKSGLVSNVKYASAQKSKKKSVRRRLPTRNTSSSLSAADLIAAKRFVDSIGSGENAKQAIDMLEELR